MYTLRNYHYSDNGDPECHYWIDVDYRVTGRVEVSWSNAIEENEREQVEVLRVEILKCVVVLGGKPHDVIKGEGGWSEQHLADLKLAVADGLVQIGVPL
jgi:hypothetical protein